MPSIGKYDGQTRINTVKNSFYPAEEINKLRQTPMQKEPAVKRNFNY